MSGYIEITKEYFYKFISKDYINKLKTTKNEIIS